MGSDIIVGGIISILCWVGYAVTQHAMPPTGESMQSCGVITLRPRPGAVPRLPETLVPMSKCVFQGAIQHVNANIEETLDSVPVPSHLLLLHHSFGDNLVDCRLDEPGRDPLSRTVTLSIIGHGICVQLQVANHIRKRVLQLL
jgi:hypothetical protein